MKQFEIDFKCLSIDGETYEGHTCFLMKETEEDAREHVLEAVAHSNYAIDHFTLEDIREIEEEIQPFDSFVRERQNVVLINTIQKGLIEAGFSFEKLLDGTLVANQFEVIFHPYGIEVTLFSEPPVPLPEIRDRAFFKRKIVKTAEEALKLLRKIKNT